MSTAEVIEQVAPPPLRSTPIDPPSSGMRPVIFAGVALALGCLAANWLAKSHYENLTGYLQARAHTVSFDRDARIAQILVRPGKGISAGQPLLTLEDADLLRQIGQQQRRVDELKLKVEQLEAQTQNELEQKRLSLEEKIYETRLRSTQLLQQRYRAELEQISEVPMEHFQGLAYLDAPVDSTLLQLKPIVLQNLTPTEGQIRNKLWNQTGSHVRDAIMEQIRTCDQHLATLNRTAQDLPERTRRGTGLPIVQSQLVAAQADLATLEKRQQALTINAPGTGIVGVFLKNAGEHVKANDPIVQVLDRDQPHLLLQIPSNRVADFPAGTIVDLKFPGEAFGKGKVTETPPQTANAPGLSVAMTQTAVQIVPAGLLWPDLPCGTMVEVRRPR